VPAPELNLNLNLRTHAPWFHASISCIYSGMDWRRSTTGFQSAPSNFDHQAVDSFTRYPAREGTSKQPTRQGDWPVATMLVDRHVPIFLAREYANAQALPLWNWERLKLTRWFVFLQLGLSDEGLRIPDALPHLIFQPVPVVTKTVIQRLG